MFSLEDQLIKVNDYNDGARRAAKNAIRAEFERLSLIEAAATRYVDMAADAMVRARIAEAQLAAAGGAPQFVHLAPGALISIQDMIAELLDEREGVNDADVQ